MVSESANIFEVGLDESLDGGFGFYVNTTSRKWFFIALSFKERDLWVKNINMQRTVTPRGRAGTIDAYGTC